MIGKNVSLCFCSIVIFFIAGTAVARVAIINAEKADEDQFPYQVSLQSNGQDICGGSIIDDDYILTAAHCVIGDNGRFKDISISVLAGTKDTQQTDKPAQNIDVKKIYVPMEYAPLFQIITGDIALLKLKSSLPLSKHITKLILAKDKNDDYSGKTAKITGFGWTWIKTDGPEEQGGNNDTILRYADADILIPGQHGYPKEKSSDKQVWARVKTSDPTKAAAPCAGDSGGPLVIDGNILIGVVAASPFGCTEKNLATIYTKVAYYYQDFISIAMKDQTSKKLRTRTL